MPELEPEAGADVTARLVEELTRTNQRLERLEAALAERSLLPGIQKEPEHSESPGAAQLAPDSTANAPANGVHATGQGERSPEADAIFRRGVAACQEGKFDEAVAAWQDVLRIQPDNPYALANIGIVLTEQGRWAEARNLFMRVIEVQPANAEAHYGLGVADAQLGDYAGDLAAWENTIRLQPDNADARNNMALVRKRLGEAGVGNQGSEVGGQGSVAAGPSIEMDTTPGAIVGKETAAPSSTPSSPSSPSSPSTHASQEPAATDDANAEESESEDTTSAAEHPAPPHPRDWKRVDSSSRASSHGAPSKRGAGRITRQPAARKSRLPVVLILAAAVIGAAALAYNYYRDTRHAAAPTLRPVPPTSRPSATASASVRTAAAPPATTAATAPATTTSTAPATTAATAPAKIVAPANSNAGATTEVPAIEAAPDAGASALAGQGPGRPGQMQLRFATGVTGRFRYWFVSGSDRAANMRWLPRANRSGIVYLWVPAEYNRPGAQLRILNVNQGKVARIPVLDYAKGTVLKSPNVGPNLLQNADFSQGAKGWSMENTAPARGTLRIDDGLSTAPGVTGRSAHFDVTAVGKQAWNVQCYQGGVNLADKQPYLFSFWAKSDRQRPLHIDVIMDKPDWHPVGLTSDVQLGPNWRKFLIHFTTSRSEPAHTRISFVLGQALGGVDVSGISLRHSQGAAKSIPVQRDTVITIAARDFN